MHPTALPQEVVDTLRARRGRRFLFDRLVPARTALVVIDMQLFFTEAAGPGAMPAARAIVPVIAAAAKAMRATGVTVAWVRSTFPRGTRDWTGYFDALNPGAGGDAVRAGLARDAPGYALAPGLTPAPGDLEADKDRFSAFFPGASALPGMLRARGIDTLLMAGTLTNVCVETSARDAMMDNFRTVLLSDACATRCDAEHQGALVTHALSFGCVQRVAEARAHLTRGRGPGSNEEREGEDGWTDHPRQTT